MITSQQKKLLKARAHTLKPVVITGAAGLSPAVTAEIDRALEHHELIKVRINADTPQQRSALAAEVCSGLQADHVQTVGHVVTLYREKPPEPPKGRSLPKKRTRYTGSAKSRTL
ncbi:ribosome assembly RNA-binding protein YhbY [Methylolobus aquaticus]